MKSKLGDCAWGAAIAAIIVVTLSVLCGFKGCMVSDGYRDGVVQKFTNKGIVFSTWEGELATRGYKRAEGEGSVWKFSVYSDEIADALNEEKPDTVIRLYYHQHRHVWPWQGATAYEVYRVEQTKDEK